MIQLHHYPSTASMAPHLVLEELGVPYELVLVDRTRNAHKSPDYLKLNPNGLIPTLVDGDLVLYETAAICLHLSDAFPKARVGPGIGDAKRPAYLTWLFYYAGVIEPVVVAKFQGRVETDPDEKVAYDAMEARLRAALRAGPFLLGDAFSAADVLLASVLQWNPAMLPRGPEFDAYLERLSSRPALKRALAKDAVPTG